MNSWIKKGIATLAMATASVGSFAFTLTSGNTTPASALAFSFNTGTGSGTLSGGGTMTYNSSLSNSTSLVLDITLFFNPSSINDGLSGSQGDRLVSFGFGIDPAATQVAFSDPQGADGGMIGAVLNANFPSFKTIDICAFGGNNCSGGAGGGIYEGQSDTFRLTLTGTWNGSVNIAPVAFKTQGPNGSFEFSTSSTGIGTTSSGRISEPATGSMAFMGLGLLAAGFVARRRKASQAA